MDRKLKLFKFADAYGHSTYFSAYTKEDFRDALYEQCLRSEYDSKEHMINNLIDDDWVWFGEITEDKYEDKINILNESPIYDSLKYDEKIYNDGTLVTIKCKTLLDKAKHNKEILAWD